MPDLVGSFAFAVSGIKMASGKRVDWLGAYIIGLATAIGGGTVRDLLLGVTPFWMLDSQYLITKSLDAQFPFWVCIIMGAITGSIGGVIRDILLNEVPLLLQKDIYAFACILGGVVYFGCFYLNLSTGLTELIAASVVIVTRILAKRYQVHLPLMQSIQIKDQNIHSS